MDTIKDFFGFGFYHITHIEGLDHILFLVALCANYRLKDWRQVLILVTAFTIGHSAALGITITQGELVSHNLIEALIPVSIMIAAGANILLILKKMTDQFTNNKAVFAKPLIVSYVITLFFGLIHGMGFSNYLLTLFEGTGIPITMPMIGFNLGLEIGQILIVLISLVISSVMTSWFMIKKKTWNLGVSSTVIVASFYLLFRVMILD